MAEAGRRDAHRYRATLTAATGRVRFFDALRAREAPVATACLGRATCGRCRIRVAGGTLSRLTDVERQTLTPEDVARGVRLACQAWLEAGDAHVEIEEFHFDPAIARLQGDGIEAAGRGRPAIEVVTCALMRPTLAAPVADSENIRAALRAARPQLATITMSPALLAGASALVRASGWHVEAVVAEDGEVLDLGPAGEGGAWGVAVDLGTTKIAIALLDYAKGVQRDRLTMLDPLVRFGDDVLTRIVHALKGPAAALSELLWEGLDEGIRRLCARNGVDPGRVYEVGIVGNTVMHHLFLGLDPSGLAAAPYVPVMREAAVEANRFFPSVNRRARVFFPPLLGEFVGSDALAVYLAGGLHEAPGAVLAIDVGTNTEIMLRHGERAWVCSAASGPAFEGGNISRGMRAARGAIESVRRGRDRLAYRVIGGGRPRGICGSGMIDLLAVLRRSGACDRFGRLTERTAYAITPDIGFTQRDVESVLAAKAAIRVGVDVLLDEAGLAPAALERIDIAGAFGAYLDLANAMAIGLLPEVPPERFRLLGNGALAGLRAMLLHDDMRQAALREAERIRVISLSLDPRFSQRFGRAMLLA